VGVGTALVTALGAMISVAVSYSGANKQIELTRQGQFTDRYSKAVEQLGTPGIANVTVRLGGIYALQRLAHDSKDDKGTIIEVLVAFVRDPAVRPKSTPPRNVVSPPTDVAAALTVLDRLGGLHGVDLHDADLTQAGLRGANLTDANVLGAHLTGADLYGANLTDADLRGADLRGADLTGAYLREANLTGADLYGANLTGADLTRAGLAGANLTDADLYGANLTDAELSGADLTGADLTHADLTDADLTDANLKDAHLTAVKGFPSPAPTGVQPS
jgi:hypothetical protein